MASCSSSVSDSERDTNQSPPTISESSHVQQDTIETSTTPRATVVDINPPSCQSEGRDSGPEDQ